MQVKQPDVFKEVTEYMFVFNSGMDMSFVLDTNAGDYCKDNGEYYNIYLSPKPSLTNPDETIPAEDVMVYKKNLAVKYVRTRNQRMPTSEELFDMQKTIHAVPKRVQ